MRREISFQASSKSAKPMSGPAHRLITRSAPSRQRPRRSVNRSRTARFMLLPLNRFDGKAICVSGRIAAVPYRAVQQFAGAQRAGRQRRSRRRRSLLVNIDTIDLAGDGGIVGMILQQSPTLMLGQEPNAVAQVGEVGGDIAREKHGMLVVPSISQPLAN